MVDFLKSSPYLVSSQPELSRHSFWVQELGRREERVVKWREGGGVGDGEVEAEQSAGRLDTQQLVPSSCHGRNILDCLSPYPQVSSKMQLLLDTWHELCTLTLSPDICSQLHDLCTSIQSHCSSLSSSSNIALKHDIP